MNSIAEQFESMMRDMAQEAVDDIDMEDKVKENLPDFDDLVEKEVESRIDDAVKDNLPDVVQENLPDFDDLVEKEVESRIDDAFEAKIEQMVRKILAKIMLKGLEE